MTLLPLYRILWKFGRSFYWFRDNVWSNTVKILVFFSFSLFSEPTDTLQLTFLNSLKLIVWHDRFVNLPSWLWNLNRSYSLDIIVLKKRFFFLNPVLYWWMDWILSQHFNLTQILEIGSFVFPCFCQSHLCYKLHLVQTNWYYSHY